MSLAYVFSGKLDEAVPLLGNQLNIVDEFNYWGWYYGVNDQPTAGLKALRRSLRLIPDQPDIQNYFDQAR